MSCFNLTQLKLEDVELQDTDDLMNLVPNQVPHNPPGVKKFSFSNGSPASLEKLLQARRPDSLPFFNFSYLLHLSLIPYGEIGNSSETTLRRRNNLLSLPVKSKGQLPERALSQIIHPQHSTTLKCLNVKPTPSDMSSAVLLGLFWELKMLVGMNVLEELKLTVKVKYRTSGEEWRRLDEILTPSNFPHLRRVKISIKVPRPVSRRLKEEILKIKGSLHRLNANASVTLLFSVSGIFQRES